LDYARRRIYYGVKCQFLHIGRIAVIPEFVRRGVMMLGYRGEDGDKNFGVFDQQIPTSEVRMTYWALSGDVLLHEACVGGMDER
jgi:hypothetical protein